MEWRTERRTRELHEGRTDADRDVRTTCEMWPFLLSFDALAHFSIRKFHAGDNVGLGNDYTLYALEDGIVEFKFKDKHRKKVCVVPAAAAN